MEVVSMTCTISFENLRDGTATMNIKIYLRAINLTSTSRLVAELIVF